MTALYRTDHTPARALRSSIAAMLALLLSSNATAEQVLHHYTVAIDESLQVMTVEARFAAPVRSVTARSQRAADYLLDFENCDDDTKIRIRNRRMIVPAGGIQCMNYTIDLDAAASDQRQNASLRDDNVVVSPAVWLWRPEINASNNVQVEFKLPGDMAVAVPWKPVGHSGKLFRIQQSPESGYAPAAFGHFEMHEVTVPGAALRVSLLQGKSPMDNGELLRWVEAAATDVSLAYGMFPNPSPLVVVMPAGNRSRRGGDSAVPFGRVLRDGGEAVELFVDQDKPLSAFLDDWTATHEFSHLLLPFVDRKHRWISEGFAMYYQNVLLARAGAYDEQRAWQKLYEGYQRGRQSRPELSPNDAAQGGRREATMKIYWSGAALALMADVELRRLSNGEQTLDTVLQQFQACCLPSSHSWSGTEFFSRLDTLSGRDVFMPLYRRYADSVGFPDPAETFARLGVVVHDGQVRLARNAELLRIRAAITRVDTEVARWRQQLAANAR
jgi:M61 glycyl aminopeptidase